MKEAYKITFTKRFLSGALRGLSIPQSCTFDTPIDAEYYMKHLNSKHTHQDYLTYDEWTPKNVRMELVGLDNG